MVDIGKEPTAVFIDLFECDIGGPQGGHHPVGLSNQQFDIVSAGNAQENFEIPATDPLRSRAQPVESDKLGRISPKWKAATASSAVDEPFGDLLPVQTVDTREDSVSEDNFSVDSRARQPRGSVDMDALADAVGGFVAQTAQG